MAASDTDLHSLVSLLTRGSIMNRSMIDIGGKDEEESIVSRVCTISVQVGEGGKLLWKDRNEEAMYDDEDDGEEEDDGEDDGHPSSSLFHQGDHRGYLSFSAIRTLARGPVLHGSAYGDSSNRVFSIIHNKDDGSIAALQLTAPSPLERDAWITGLSAVLEIKNSKAPVLEAKDVKLDSIPPMTNNRSTSSSSSTTTPSVASSPIISHPPLHPLRSSIESSYEEKESTVNKSRPTRVIPSKAATASSIPSKAPSSSSSSKNSEEITNVVSLDQSTMHSLEEAVGQLTELCAKLEANSDDIDGVMLTSVPLSLSPSSTHDSLTDASSSASSSFLSLLCRALSHNTHVRLLSFSSCSITADSLSFIADLLAKNRSLHALILRDDDLHLTTEADAKGIHQLCHVLTNGSNRTLKQLYLKHNRLGKYATKHIASLIHSSSLQALDISGNALGDAIDSHTLSLCDLSSNRSLQALGLDENNLSDSVGKALLDALKKNHFLHTLTISDNQFSSITNKAIEREITKRVNK